MDAEYGEERARKEVRIITRGRESCEYVRKGKLKEL